MSFAPFSAPAGTPDYHAFLSAFSPEREAARLAGSLQALNACVECCSRHLGGQRLALRAIDADGQRRDYSFEQLDTAAARFANVLVAHGVRPGERVAGLLPRTFELLVTILGS